MGVDDFFRAVSSCGAVREWDGADTGFALGSSFRMSCRVFLLKRMLLAGEFRC
jgi:hypothetical protein